MTLNRKTLLTLLLLIAALLAIGGLGVMAAETEEVLLPEAAEAETVQEAVLPEDGAPEESLSSEHKAAEHTITFLDADGGSLSEQKVADGQTLQTLPKNGSVEVAHWFCVTNEKYYTAAELLALPVTADMSFRDAGVCVTYYKDKSTVLGTEYVRYGGTPAGLKDSDVTNWLDENDKFIVMSRQTLTKDTAYYAWYTPGLTSKHVAYINGFTATSFAPGNNLTRAQAAVILYRLLENQSMGPFEVSFTDVSETASYATAVKTLASYGIITGYSDGTFRPKEKICRGDFVLMISRLFTLESAEWTFESKYATRYYADAVASAAKKGWIGGYTDGTFRPLAYVTRAEAVKIINRVLGRTPDKTAIDALGHRIFTDVDDTSYWAFYEIMEAATGDGYSLSPISSLKEGLQIIGSKYYYVDSTKTFKVLEAGLQTVGGKTLYVSSAAAGVKKYSGGIHEFGGKLYLLESDGTVRTEPASGYDTRVTEYGSSMYYIQKDGSLLRDGYYGHLYFGSKGAYTSGSSTLDSMVYSYIKDIINSDKTQERKLYAGYIAVRDRTPNTSAYKRYANLNSWSNIYCAEIFLQNGRGSCREFGCAMVYVAQRLGYDCYYMEGYLRSGAVHVWELIDWPDGKTYLMDVEQEWGFLYGWYGSAKYDCYLMEWDPEEYISYGDRYDNDITNIWSPYYPA